MCWWAVTICGKLRWHWCSRTGSSAVKQQRQQQANFTSSVAQVTHRQHTAKFHLNWLWNVLHSYCYLLVHKHPLWLAADRIYRALGLTLPWTTSFLAAKQDVACIQNSITVPQCGADVLWWDMSLLNWTGLVPAACHIIAMSLHLVPSCISQKPLEFSLKICE